MSRFLRYLALGDGASNALRLCCFRIYFRWAGIIGRSVHLRRPVRVHVRTRATRFSFEVRGPIDLALLENIFVREEYRLPDGLQPKAIVDLGGNIGMSAWYFRSRYPDATITIVEPDPQNLRSLHANLGAAPDRTTVIPAAIAAESGKEVELFSDPTSHWSTSLVHKASANVSFLAPTLSLDGLLATIGQGAIDIMKFDVEGAEYEAFRNFSGIEKVEFLVGEYHPDLCGRSLDAFIGLFPRFDVIRKEVGTKRSFVVLRRKDGTRVDS